MEEIFKNPFYQKNYIPVLSFIIGTILLLLLALTGESELLFIGLLYVFIASFINLIYAVFLIFIFYKKQKNNEEVFSRLGITLINIPITILYIYIVFEIIL